MADAEIYNKITRIERELTDLKKLLNNQPKPNKNKQNHTLVVSAFMQSLVEVPSDTIIFSIDKNYNYVAFNTNYRKYIKQIVGKEIEIGDNVLDVIRSYKNFEQEKAFFERAFAGEEFYQVGDYTNNAQTHYYEDIYKPVKHNGQVIGITVFFTNTTEKNRTAKTWNVLLRISEAVHSTHDLHDFIRNVHTELSELIDTTNFFVAMYDIVNEVYTFPYFIDQFDEVSAFTPMVLKKSLTDYVRRTGKPLLTNQEIDAELIEKGEVDIIGTPSPSWLGVPLKNSSDTIGVMVVQNYKRQNAYTYRDLELMAFVSDHIAMAIERKRIENELKDNEQRLKIAQSVAHVGHWEIELPTRMVRLSDEAFRIYGFEKKGDYIHLSKIQELIHPDDKKRMLDAVDNLNKQQPHYDEEYRLIKANTAELVVIHSKAEYVETPNTSTKKILGMVQDITKRNLVKLELKRAKEKAEEADMLKTSFLANMSHEIRTPMNAIIGFSRLLAAPDISENQKKEYISYINNSGNNLLNLINDILDVAKIEAGQVMVKKTYCAVNNIIDELKKTFDRQLKEARKNNIAIETLKAIPRSNFAIHSDPFRLRQVLANLIGNALKFIENGYIRFGYEVQDSQNLLFFVEDTGIGIPPDKREIIFSRFGQIEGGKIKNPGGTGLGLSISKHLIELMGGNIWVNSEPNSGTTFYFTIPNIPPPKNEQNNNEKRISNAEKLSFLNHKKILLVEDNPINQKLVVDTFFMFNPSTKVTVVDNGQAAISSLKRHKFDLILMDVRMPGMDGYQTTLFIRSQFEPPKNAIPILGLSAHAMKEEKEKSEAAGMDAFMTKPFIPEELFDKVINLLLHGNNRQFNFIEKQNSLNFSEITEEFDVSKKTKIPAFITKIEQTLDNHTQPFEGTQNIENISSQTSPKNKLTDLSLLRKMYSSNLSQMSAIVDLCKKNIPNQIDKMLVCNKQEDWKNLRLTAHSLKSTLGYLGMEKQRELARQIETNTEKNQNLNQIEKLINQMAADWILAEQELNNY